MYKIYQLTNNRVSLSTVIGVNGRAVPVEFTGGAASGNYKIPGKFGTSSEDLQKAMESSPAFGKDYTLLHEENPEAIKEPVVAPAPESSDVADNIPSNELSEIKTNQAAKNYLMEKFPDLTPENLKNRAMILDVAKAKNIDFPNLK